MRLKREARAKGGFYVEPEAKIMFVMRLRGGDMKPVLAGLERVKSFLRREVSKRVKLRYVPDLKFMADTTFDEAQHIDELMHRPEVARDLAGGRDESDGT